MATCNCGKEMVCMDARRFTFYCPDCCVINGKSKKDKIVKPVVASVFVKEIPEWFSKIDEVSFGDGILGEDYDWSTNANPDYPIELKMTIEVVRKK